MTLNVLSLFSGIGGLELGLERAGMHVVGQVEIDHYCRRVLARHWPEVPRHDDVRTCVQWWRSELRPDVDLICGGFPCQDISNAGRRAGIDGERSGLWAWMRDAIRDLRPRYALLENVSAILVRGLDTVAADLAAIGYDLQWDCIPAAAVGAPHRRDRWFGVAHAQSERPGQGRSWRPAGTRANGQAEWAETLADAISVAGKTSNTCRMLGRTTTSGRVFRTDRRRSGLGQHWATEPAVGRVAHGIPARVDRLRALGNAVVPQVAERVGRLIVEYDDRAAVMA
jgi:DNA (cytosine-5)-methyltransferase 1